MQRKFINLQQFAEDSAEENKPDAQQTQESKQKADKDNKELKYSDEDVNRLLNQKFAEWQKKKENEISEAQKLAEMNAQERAEHERDQLKKQLEELNKKNTLSEMSATARKMLADSGINVQDELLKLLVTADADKTKNAVASFTELFNNAVKNAVASQLKSPAPKTSTGGNVTKAQIMEIKDRAARQKAINENIELFR